MNKTIIYRGKSTSGEQYHIGCEDFILPSMEFIVKRYPRIKNLYYGWDKCTGTEKPAFKVPDNLPVFNNIWSHINKISNGEYILIARDHRAMHVYKRMLQKSAIEWKILDRGLIYDVNPYIIISKVI